MESISVFLTILALILLCTGIYINHTQNKKQKHKN